MNFYLVTGESSAYAERLQWPVDIWPTKELAEARVKQLTELVKQLGWPAIGLQREKFGTRSFMNLIDRLAAVEHGDPSAVWNFGELYIRYTMDAVKAKGIFVKLTNP
jgi:hypothetical protein